MELTSSAFEEGKTIPTEHTCDGQDLSPALQWSGAPEETGAFALVVDDPDAPAGTWVHWVLYGVPADRSELPEGIPAAETALDGARQGRNDFQRLGYGGPCPPPNGAHRYRFTLYALAADTGLEPGATKERLLEAIEGHVLARARLTGSYRRR